jgi:DNA-binding Xre family transcriptional regulator
MQVYQKVRKYIESHYLKQKSIAEAAGIPNTTFNAMMNGKRKLYAEELKAICCALNVSANTFIEIDSKKEAQ